MDILIVDDDIQVRELINGILSRKGFECNLAADACEARALLKKQRFKLIISDINMPGESGMDLVKSVLTAYSDIAAIMLTGIDDSIIAEKALELGVYDYIIKPFKPDQVLISITNALRRRELEINERNYRQNLEQLIAERTTKLRTALEGVVQTTAKTVEVRDPYTAGHQRRVADLAYAIGVEMNLPGDTLEGIHMTGVIHDLGKVSVPAEILSKPSRLTEVEFGIIKGHPQVGHDILKDIELPWPVADIVLQHHERIDGSGYPQNLKGEEILLEARILAIADVVEAIASHRPYRAALGIDKALDEIIKNKGIFYDPDATDCCLRVFKEKKYELMS